MLLNLQNPNFDILCRKMISCAGRIDSVVKFIYNSRNKLRQNFKSNARETWRVILVSEVTYSYQNHCASLRSV